MPYGSESGKSGLDVLLSFSMFTNNIGVFFVSDGIYQILSSQNPKKYSFKNHTVIYKLLDFYDIKEVYLCKEDLKRRGISYNNDIFIIPVKIVSIESIRINLLSYDAILNF